MSMHYHAEIWLPDIPIDLKAAVDEAMAAHIEEYRDNEPRRGFWDWYQIGGRWKGAHVPGYNANQDPENLVECLHPYVRNHGLPDSACDYCKGRDGKTVSWPTQWKPHKKDVILVSEVPDGLTCSTLIVGAEAFEKERWTGDKWVDTDFDGDVKKKLAALGITSGVLVTVDYHS